MYALFKTIMRRSLESLESKFHRFMYNNINLELRMQGVLGPRGVGKTTLMLQLIKDKCADKNDVLYFSADHIYFEQTRLYDFVNELYEVEGMRHLFIDEIHKYKNWNQELKNIYDAFPDLKIVFSGSSSIDLVKGAYDLSRRAILNYLPGLSFREYLNFKYETAFETVTFSDLTQAPHTLEAQLQAHLKLPRDFEDYLKHGYYPFVFEDKLNYEQRILNVIDKAIYEDIANFYALKTQNLSVFKKILNFLATIPPGTVNVHGLAKDCSVDNKTMLTYLTYLEEIKLVSIIYSEHGGKRLLRKPEKIFLDNTTLLNVLNAQTGHPADEGAVRELFFVQAVKASGHSIFYVDRGDFIVNDTVFEIGGKRKSRKQVQEIKDAILVKDDIMLASTGVLPLHYFGFLY